MKPLTFHTTIARGDETFDVTAHVTYTSIPGQRSERTFHFVTATLDNPQLGDAPLTEAEIETVERWFWDFADAHLQANAADRRADSDAAERRFDKMEGRV